MFLFVLVTYFDLMFVSNNNGGHYSLGTKTYNWLHSFLYTHMNNCVH